MMVGVFFFNNKITRFRRHQINYLKQKRHLESCWAPVYKLDGTFCFDGGDCCIDIFWDHITPEQEAAGHVLAVARITFHHLVAWLEASVGDFSYGQLFMVSLEEIIES